MLAEIYYWFTEGFDTADLKKVRWERTRFATTAWRMAQSDANCSLMKLV
jgi:hypothetical protein